MPNCIACSPRTKFPKIRRCSAGRDAQPLVAHANRRCLGVRGHRHLDDRPRGEYLTALSSTFHSACPTAHRIDQDDASAGSSTRTSMTASRVRPSRTNSATTWRVRAPAADLLDVKGLPPSSIRRKVEQRFDQPLEAIRVSREHLIERAALWGGRASLSVSSSVTWRSEARGVRNSCETAATKFVRSFATASPAERPAKACARAGEAAGQSPRAPP